ncbi:uncharacterized protein LOC114240652 [Bombyx mandarina]|uniref:Uncharacterized protein LOC114240652 n=1 Tax=Bombyx mandarina TaxID=7092 RepID=A0A6J2JCC5_BOMMA|nr:uncharacterized protein LOC114240652 [Bombyx mandarina]
MSSEEIISSTSEQEAATKLRESFLRSIRELSGFECTILTYEKSSLKAKFSSWKPDGSEILVHGLETPACVVMDSALLRTPDLLAIQFENHLDLP